MLKIRHAQTEPIKIDADKIKKIMDENPYSIIRNIADELQISHSTVIRHIHRIDSTEAKMAGRTDIRFFKDADKNGGN